MKTMDIRHTLRTFLDSSKELQNDNAIVNEVKTDIEIDDMNMIDNNIRRG